MFYYCLLFQHTNEINSFIETNYGDHNFIHITNKLSSYSACRARNDGRVALAALVVTCRAVTCGIALAVEHARHSTYNFLYQNAWNLGLSKY